MEAILNGLNPAQRAAVTSPSTVLQVLAPPGSGKTKTLTARVAYLIEHDGLNPRHIIVCTFTIKAANEMKERIEHMLGRDVSSKLILGTYHSVARRLLAVHGHLIGIPDKFGIADSSDSKAIVTRIVKALKLSINPARARSRISTLKAKAITPEKYNEDQRMRNRGSTARYPQAGKFGAQTQDDLSPEEMYVVWTQYEAELRQSNLLDYDDLLLRCAELLRNYPACVSHVEAVLVDEFQDTNHIQFDLMCQMAHYRNVITTVGDPDQSIYGWRSADATNLDKMRDRYPETHVANLEENYRSSGMILLTAQEVIDQDQSRPQKSLVPTHALGTSPVLRKLASADVEAKWIVSEIQRTLTLSAGLLGYDDYAILLRSASLSRLIESHLGLEGIPYRMVGGHRFFDRVEVRLILDYLRVIHQPSNAEALSRILNVPPRRIGDATVASLLDEAREQKSSLWRIVKQAARGLRPKAKALPAQAEKGLANLFNIISSAQDRLLMDDTGDLVEFIDWLLKRLGLKAYLRDKYQDEFDARWANVEELTSQASELVKLAQQEASVVPVEEGHYVGESATAALDARIATKQYSELSRAEALSMFLGNVALATEKQDASEENNSRGHVVISTIHAAKGLEWPVVFVPAVYEGSIPHSRAENTDEERRLLYVAMTRAQAMLYTSWPLLDSSKTPTKLSQFLSIESLTPRFLSKGPGLKVDEILEAALILRRDCPTPRSISSARSTMVQPEDIQWNLSDGQEHRASFGICSSDLGHDDYCERPRKRPQAEQAGSSKRHIQSCGTTMITTSMDSKASFSVASAAFSTFVSAARVPRQDHANPIIDQAEDGHRVPTRSRCKPDQPLAKHKPIKTATGSITNYFQRAQSADHAVAVKPQPQRPRKADEMALRDVGNMFKTPGRQEIGGLTHPLPAGEPVGGRPVGGAVTVVAQATEQACIRKLGLSRAPRPSAKLNKAYNVHRLFNRSPEV